MKFFKTALLTVGFVGAMTLSAQADYVFSGTGNSGTLSGSTQNWSFNYNGTGNWGSPGVEAGVRQYGLGDTAYGFVITFTGPGTINANSITIGNNAACAGSLDGGSTFCTIGPNNIWEASLVGPSSIQFLAQDASYALDTNQDYFVNIFFDGGTPTGFTGSWLTSFSPNGPGSDVPEPATLALLGAGLLGLGRFRTRRKAA